MPRIAAFEHVLVDVQMAYLMRGVHAGVGSSGHGKAQRFGRVSFRYAKNGMQHAFDFALYRTYFGLFRPSVEAGTVICQIDA